MTGMLVLSALAAAVGLVVLRRVGRSRGAMTVADLALLLACAEIVQVLYTLTTVDVALNWDPSVLPGLCLIGLVLAVLGSFAEWVAKLVTAVGVVAALVDTWLSDGPSVAALLVVTIVLVWLINRLVRLLLPF